MNQDVRNWIEKEKKRNPNFVEDMEAGRYMPRCNGRRVIYRGKDKWLGVWNEILELFFHPVMIWIWIFLIIYLITIL